jgi:hypothetical protein
MIQTRRFQIRLLGMAAFVGVGLFDASAAAHACDEFVSRLIDKAIQPSIKSLDCGLLGKAGFEVKRLNDAHARSASPSQLAHGCVFETDFLGYQA